MLRPLNDRVVIVTEKDPEKSKGGVYLPESTQKERKDRGIVIASGPGKLNSAGVLVPTGVKPDDMVMFGRYGGMDIELDGQSYIVVGADDIVCVIEDEDEGAQLAAADGIEKTGIEAPSDGSTVTLTSV